MGKIQRITGLQYKFSLFNLSEDFDTYYNRFLESDLGKIYLGIPWNDLVESFELEESSKGTDSLFSSRGKLGLMILKNSHKYPIKK